MRLAISKSKTSKVSKASKGIFSSIMAYTTPNIQKEKKERVQNISQRNKCIHLLAKKPENVDQFHFLPMIVLKPKRFD